MGPREGRQGTEPRKENNQEIPHPSDIEAHPIWEKDPDDVEEEEEGQISPQERPSH